MRPLLLLGLLVLACSHPPQPPPLADVPPFEVQLAEPVRASLLVAMERTACRGTCPRYRVFVSGDGTVEYLGIANVKHVGLQHALLPPAQLEALKARLARATLGEAGRWSCPHGVTDLPGVALVVPDAGLLEPACYPAMQAVRERPLLDGLDVDIDRLVGVERWAGAPL